MKKYYKFLRKSLIELKKNDGFTLAEVLITLGIIGVVAAMTIPTLIANTQGQRVRSQFKKTLSTLNQAGRMAQAQYDWDFGAIELTEHGSDSCIKTDNPESKKSMCALLNGTLKGSSYSGETNATPLHYKNKIFSGFSVRSNNDIASDYLLYLLPDGALFGFYQAPSACTLDISSVLDSTILNKTGGTNSNGITTPGLKQCIGFIDVNGASLPNKEVACADGTAALDPQNPCVVSNKNIGDVIPVVFHDGVVEPATNAGKYLLNTAK